MTVAEIMTTEVITAGMDDTLGGIRKVFELHHCNHIPIIEENRLVGIVSDRDVLRGLSPNVDSVRADNRALNTLKKKAHQVMTRQVHTISPDDTIENAVTIFLEKQCSCLPVLDQSGRVVGILTKTDLLKCLRSQMQLLAAVS
jgi:acetoin utilization protein AcuB